jgi:hypothetical protein
MPAIKRTSGQKLNQKQYAAHRGVKPQYISRLVREGRIPTTREGLIDVARADRALGPRVNAPRMNSRRSASASKATHSRRPSAHASKPASALAGGHKSATGSLTEARARKVLAEAQSAELALARERGELLSRDEVLAAQRKQNTNIRARLRMLPRAAAGVLAPVSSPAEIERLLLELIDRELADLARDPLNPQPSAPVQTSAEETTGAP